jgi:hypothetical protein
MLNWCRRMKLNDRNCLAKKHHNNYDDSTASSDAIYFIRHMEFAACSSSFVKFSEHTAVVHKTSLSEVAAVINRLS